MEKCYPVFSDFGIINSWRAHAMKILEKDKNESFTNYYLNRLYCSSCQKHVYEQWKHLLSAPHLSTFGYEEIVLTPEGDVFWKGNCPHCSSKMEFRF